tara:strand:- start:1899 stop:2843 length:945 start_codon:yes stop_codon:yes gene_type:complete
MKVLVVKNRYTKKLNWTKGIQYFTDKTPLKLEVTELSTDFDFTFRTVRNHKYGNRVDVGVVGGDYYQKLRSVVPDGVYDVVCLVYGNDNPYIRVSIAENEPLYPNTDVIQVVKLTDGGKTFNHELIHAIFKRLSRHGINLTDPMDTYLADGSLTATVSNRTMALEALKPHWDTIQKPILSDSVVLRRDYDDGTQTLGTLSIKRNGASLTLKTLELSYKNNARNISSIPKGIYRCFYTFSTRFLKYTYEIMNVPCRTGIRIHSANYVSSLQGCVALGMSHKDINQDGRQDAYESKKALDAFEGMLGRQPFTLTII